jgi:hypothetical protein
MHHDATCAVIEAGRETGKDADPLNGFLEARRSIKETAPRFFQNPTTELESTLRSARLKLATAILEFEAPALADLFASPLFDCHDLLRKCHLDYAPLLDAERHLVDSLVPICRAGWDNPATAKAYLVLMLFRQAYQIPLDLDLPRVPAWLRRVYTLFLVMTPTLFSEPGDLDRYVDHVERVLARLYDQLPRAADSVAWRGVLEDSANFLNFLQVLFVDRNMRSFFERRARLAERLLELDGAALDWPAGPAVDADARLRVGFLVRDGSPRTESFITLPHVRDIDPARYETFLYAVAWNQGAFQDHLRHAFEHFADLSDLTLARCVELIRRDRLDYILLANVNYARIEQFNKIAAHRLARVQMATTAISPATTGFRNVDCMLSAPWTEPEDDPQAHYTERLVLTEGSFNCFDFGPPRSEPADAAPKLLSRIPDDAVVFTAGAAFFKLIPELTRVWMEILARAPDGYLVMFFQNPNWAPRYPTYFLVRRLVHECRDSGADASRLLIMPPLTRGDIDAIIARTDVYLDSYPYSGAASLMDPLPAGVPVVAWRGVAQRGIQGAAMLRAIGLDDWIADSADAYRDKALALARDPGLRRELAARIRERMRRSPFLDTKGYAARFMGTLEALNPRRH